jgi:hypothetical protein
VVVLLSFFMYCNKRRTARRKVLQEKKKKKKKADENASDSKLLLPHCSFGHYNEEGASVFLIRIRFDQNFFGFFFSFFFWSTLTPIRLIKGVLLLFPFLRKWGIRKNLLPTAVRNPIVCPPSAECINRTLSCFLSPFSAIDIDVG